MKPGTGLGAGLGVALLMLLAWYLLLRSPPRSASSTNNQPSVTVHVTTPTEVENRAPPAAFPPPAPPQDGRPQEEVVGIGAVLSRPGNQDSPLRITSVLPNSPSEAAGLVGPLEIHKIDGIPVSGLSLQECVAMVRGAPGTKVRLELSKPSVEQTFEVDVTRQRIVVPRDGPQFRRIPAPEQR